MKHPLFAALLGLGMAGNSLAATKDYTFSSFTATSDKTRCEGTVSVSLSGSPSVTKTRFTGKSGSHKPSNVNLSVGSRSDDTTPTGSDGSWAGSTNAFNGSAFSNGTWKMTIKPIGALPGSDTARTPPKPTPAAPARPSTGSTLVTCNSFEGTVLTFEY